MHAVTIVGGTLEWLEHPDPEPGPGEVLVSVAAAGVNAADLLQRMGLYPPPPGFPVDIPGMEFAGEVVGLGRQATRFALGDRVMSITGGGAQAELAVVDQEIALPVPDGVPIDQAGGFPEAFCTAHDALFTQAHLSAGERVLVSGAAGGVGTAAVQLAHAAGAKVVASVRSEARRQQVLDLGADQVTEPDRAADHGPYDVSLELVGAPGVAAVLPALAIGGRIVVIGVGAGSRVELDLLSMMTHRATLRASTLRVRTTKEKATVARAVGEDPLALFARGAVRVPVAERVPMAKASEAYDLFAAGGKFGKIVLVT